MKHVLALSLFTLSLAMLSTPALAWLVPCDGGDLPRCEKACSDASGTLVTNPNDGSKWCKIPYRISSTSKDPVAGVLAKGGYDLKKGTSAFSQASESGSPSY